MDAERPGGEECTIDFGDLDPELVRALLRDGGRIWASAHLAGVARAYYSRGQKSRRNTACGLYQKL